MNFHSSRAFLLLPGQSKSTLDAVFQKIAALNIKLDNCRMQQVSSDDLIRVNLLNDQRIASIKYNILNEPSILFELSGKSIDKKVADIQENFPTTFTCLSAEILEFFFKNDTTNNQKLPRNENQRDSLLCLIKPHIVHSNRTGDILAQIYSHGFVVANIKLCHLDRSQCDDFYRVYEGVLPESIQMSIHLASGPLLALELCMRDAQEEDGHVDWHSTFRNLCGPYDSVKKWILCFKVKIETIFFILQEIAQKLRPHTLRGRFGVDKVCNAVHCTDLKGDVQLELDFFFS